MRKNAALLLVLLFYSVSGFALLEGGFEGALIKWDFQRQEKNKFYREELKGGVDKFRQQQKRERAAFEKQQAQERRAFDNSTHKALKTHMSDPVVQAKSKFRTGQKLAGNGDVLRAIYFWGRAAELGSQNAINVLLALSKHDPTGGKAEAKLRELYTKKRNQAAGTALDALQQYSLKQQQ